MKFEFSCIFKHLVTSRTLLSNTIICFLFITFLNNVSMFSPRHWLKFLNQDFLLQSGLCLKSLRKYFQSMVFFASYDQSTSSLLS